MRLDHLLSREFPIIGNSRSVGRYIPITSSSSLDRTAVMVPVAVIFKLNRTLPSTIYLVSGTKKRPSKNAGPLLFPDTLSISREVSEHGYDFALDFYVVRSCVYRFHLAIGGLQAHAVSFTIQTL